MASAQSIQVRIRYEQLGPRRQAPKIQAQLKIGIVPVPDFTLMSLSCFVEFLRLASDEDDFSRQIFCQWELLSHNKEPIRASCGFEISPTALFGDPRDYDYIVVHGGILHSDKEVPDELCNFVRGVEQAGVPLIGLCTGQFLLAELGLMNGRKCAVHFSLEVALRERFPQLKLISGKHVVRDGPFITCPGGLSAIELAKELVGERCGQLRVEKVLRYLMAEKRSDLPIARGGAEGTSAELDPQFRDRRIDIAVAAMRQKMSEFQSVDEIARLAGTSERELTRLFQKHLRMPPAQYWRQMRLRNAHWKIVNTDLSVTEIAYECGFSDSSHLIRWFRRLFGTTPTKLRSLHSEMSLH